MSVRKIPKNYRSVTGLVASRKSDEPIQFESTLERDFILLCEEDPEVRRIREQPVRIEYRDENGRLHHYTPDVLLTFDSAAQRRPELIEVKPEASLDKDRLAFARKFRAARAYARTQGWRFKVKKERHIRGPFLDNVKFLRQYRTRPADAQCEARIMANVRANSHLNAERLLAALAADTTDRAHLVPSLWRLVANRMIGCDLSQPLTMQSELWDANVR